MEIIDQIKQVLGKPIITINQAMLWSCLRHLEIENKLTKHVGLFREF